MWKIQCACIDLQRVAHSAVFLKTARPIENYFLVDSLVPSYQSMHLIMQVSFLFHVSFDIHNCFTNIYLCYVTFAYVKEFSSYFLYSSVKFECHDCNVPPKNGGFLCIENYFRASLFCASLTNRNKEAKISD